MNTKIKPEDCTVIDDKGQRCPCRAQFWVGRDGTDDWTLVCADHIEIVRGEGYAVISLDEARKDLDRTQAKLEDYLNCK